MEKGQQCEIAKEAYREQLTKTNNSQTLHYSTSFPQLNDVSQNFHSGVGCSKLVQSRLFMSFQNFRKYNFC
jgi:hypothetical protein